MTSRARVEYDFPRDGVRIALQARSEDAAMLLWGDSFPAIHVPEDPTVQAPEEAWLHIHEDHARAIYEALADYFGHSGHDTRALRRDYDNERQRVDRMINALIREP